MKKPDPVSIEGSPERAADRGHPGLLQIPDPDGNSLATPSGVQRVLWAHVQDVVAWRGQWLEGKLDADGVVARLKAASEQRQAIMYGVDPAYGPNAWNNRERLGEHLVRAVAGGSSEDAALRAFVQIHNDVVKTLVAHEKGEVTDEMTQACIEDLVLRYTGHFLGVPPEVYAGEPS